MKVNHLRSNIREGLTMKAAVGIASLLSVAFLLRRKHLHMPKKQTKEVAMLIEDHNHNFYIAKKKVPNLRRLSEKHTEGK